MCFDEGFVMDNGDVELCPDLTQRRRFLALPADFFFFS